MGFIGRVIGPQDVGICRIARDDSSCKNLWVFQELSPTLRCVKGNRKKSQNHGGQWSHQNCAFI